MPSTSLWHCFSQLCFSLFLTFISPSSSFRSVWIFLTFQPLYPFSLTRDWSFRTCVGWKTCWLWRQQTCYKPRSSLLRPCSGHMVCLSIRECRHYFRTFTDPHSTPVFLNLCVTSSLSQTGTEKSFWRRGCWMLRAAVSARAWPCPPHHPVASMPGTPCPLHAHPEPHGPHSHSLSPPPPTAASHLERRAWLRWDTQLGLT